MEKDKFRQQAEELVGQMTLDEKLLLLTGHQHPIERLDLKEFFIGTEIARGFVGRGEDMYSTVFPQPIGLAGTFDVELMERLGEIAGNECRAYYNSDDKSYLCVWGPTVDMERNPLWGRTEEAYGEDVLLAGEMTAYYTRGLAGDNGEYYKTIPTLKHFCANNNEHNRMSCDAFLPPRLKYEYYYSAFMNAIKYGGARSVMTAYNSINGIPAMCNPELETILREQWGLWFTVTDGADFSQTVTAHHYCESHAEAFSEGIKSGCDNMTDNDILVRNAAKKAIQQELVTEEDIDRALTNVMYGRIKLGQLDENCPYNTITKEVLDSKESAEMNLRATREQVTLLKNNGILPLKPTKGKIAVVGALADENLSDWYTGVFRNAISPYEGIKKEFPDNEVICDNLWDIVSIKAPNGKYLSVKEDGSVIADADEVTDSELFELQDWGENWNNLFSVKYKKYLKYDNDTLKLNKETIYDWFTRETLNLHYIDTDYDLSYVIEEYLGHKRMTCDENGVIVFRENVPVNSDNVFTFYVKSLGDDRAIDIAEECDYVIYCVGNHPVQVAKECHDRKTLELNIQRLQLGMIEDNENTIMVLISSYPYSICTKNETTPAIIYTTHAGANLGTAIAETLSGKNNPSGRLAMTWYKSELDLPDIMDYDIEKTGTTYMYFKGEPLYPFGYGLSYSKFEYSNFTVNNNNGIVAEVTVKNVSDVDGTEVVQLYYTVKDSAVTRPLKKLCAFARVELKAGEEKTVRLNVPEHILQIYDTHIGKMITETGIYTFSVGNNSSNLLFSKEIEITGQVIAVRESNFNADSFDEYYGIRICWSKRLHRHYVKALGWTGATVYKDVPFGAGESIKVTASSVFSEAKLYIKFNDTEIELKLNASDGFDDFEDYTIKLPEGLPEIGNLKISMSEGVSIMDIEVK